jgi:glyoxylase-like metal-dependent hydrolase (beta-lactamase superfamily II)
LLLVERPLEERPLLDAIAAEGGVHTIVATHWHQYHWMTYDAVRAATGAPVLVGGREIKIPPERIDGRLEDGQEVRVGATRITVLHTPGHTPGSISLRVGRVVITGDTLFDGSPGRPSPAATWRHCFKASRRVCCRCRRRRWCCQGTAQARRSVRAGWDMPRTNATRSRPVSTETCPGAERR